MNNESIQIHINSKYATRYNNQHYSDIDVELPMIEVPSGYTINLSVLHAVIPYSFYNVNSTNNTLMFSEYQLDPPINTTVIIPYGNYNVNQLTSYLNNSNLLRTTVSYNSIINKLTFTNTTNEFKILSGFSTCQNLLGFSNNDLYNTSIGKSLTLSNQINTAQTRMINISTNLNTGCINNIRGNLQDILCCLPVTKQPYSMIEYTNNNNFKVNLNTNTLNFINIKLMNQDGNMLELNQQFFSITLQLDIVNFTD